MCFSNPLPYLEVRRPFILGTQRREWKPTLSHAFVALLARRGVLTRVYTQNIDGLDHACGLPEDAIVDVHGSIGRAACEACGAEQDFDAFCDRLRAGVRDIYSEGGGVAASAPVPCTACGSPLVKPATVLYGRSMPARFKALAEGDCARADLLIVVGTSLTVFPAASLVHMVPRTALRLVVNTDAVGTDIGLSYRGDPYARDALLRAPCDDAFAELARALGWLDDLTAVVAEGEFCAASRAALGLPA